MVSQVKRFIALGGHEDYVKKNDTDLSFGLGSLLVPLSNPEQAGMGPG